MIDKRVYFLGYNAKELSGIVMDAYIGYNRVNFKYPSGQGGSISLENPIPITFYLVKLDDGKLESVTPNRINKIQ